MQGQRHGPWRGGIRDDSVHQVTTFTATEIGNRLHNRYPAPEWAAFCELRDGPGFNQRRTVDFFAVNTWPSKGLAAVAVEVKVSRADFRRELDHPEKRATIIPYVNEFWFAAPRGVINQKEVPDGCGLLETWGDKLRATIRAKQFMDREPDRALWTVIARRCADDRKCVEKARQEFAEFKGRSVSLEDLKRLAKKLFEHNWEVRDRFRNDIAAEMREERAPHKSGYLTPAWCRVLEALWKKIRDIENLGWNAEPSPEHAAAFLRRLSVDQDLHTLGEQLRRMAEKIDPAQESAGEVA
jgi:hypothetical protein